MEGRPPYPYLDDELRKVARDAYVSWKGSRYSVPREYAGRSVWVRERGQDVEVHFGGENIAVHNPALHAQTVVTQASIIVGFRWGHGGKRRS
jgi:hypothetical protein